MGESEGFDATRYKGILLILICIYLHVMSVAALTIPYQAI